MKDRGIAWINKLPSSWQLIKLKYIASKIERGTSPEYTDTELTMVVNQATFSKGWFDTSNIRFSTKPAYLSRGLLLINDILLASTGGGVLGKTFYFEENETYVADGHVTIVRSEETKMYSKFLFYFFKVNYETFNAVMAEGSTNQTELQRDLLSNMFIPLPSLPEQRSIAAYLDRKCAEIDALSADIQKQIVTLEEYKRSVITEAVTKGLDKNVEMKDSGVEWIEEIPKVWEMRKGKYLFVQRNTRGNTISLQLLSPTQRFGVIPQDKYEQLTGMNAVKLDENTNLSLLKTICNGDFCISLRSFQGGFEYSQYEGVVSPAYQVFYSFVNTYNGYFKYLFKEQAFIEKMNSFTMSLRDGKNIAFSNFGNTYIPYPPLDEQKAITSYLDEKCSEIEGLINEKKKQLLTLDEYKKSLIFEYVTGKKEVKNKADYEYSITFTNDVAYKKALLLCKIKEYLNDKLKGRIHAMKGIYLIEYFLNLNSSTEYVRAKHGPYDKKIEEYEKICNKNNWLSITYGNPIKYDIGVNISNYKNIFSSLFSNIEPQIEKVLDFITSKTSKKAERTATLFAVWNDFIIDGNKNPTDEQIIHEVMTNWTDNKANILKETWQDTLNKMKSIGLIPHGFGLHTKFKNV